jgi:MFS family permease
MLSARSKTDWGLVALLVGTGIVAALHIGKMPPALPLLLGDLHATLEQGGWLLSIVHLTTAVGGMAIALGADRFGHRRLVIGGTAICLVGSLVGATLQNVAPLLVVRFFEGLGFIAVTVAATPLLLRLAAPGDSRLVMGVWSTYMPAGAGAMMLVAALILPFASWRAVWLVAAAASAIVLAALLLRAAPRRELDPGPAAPRPMLGDAISVVTSVGPLAIAVCFGAYSCCFIAVVGFLPTLQVERLGMSVSTAAIVTAVVTFVNVGGNLAAGWLLHRGVPRVVLIVGATLPMAFCAAGIFVDGIPDAIRLVLAGLYSAVVGIVPAALFAAIPVHAPRPHLVGAATGLLMQGSNVGALLGPPIIAALVASGGWPKAAWLTSVALGITAAAGLFLHWRERRKVAP